MYQAEFESRPIELRIAVQPHGQRAPEPAFRSQRHMFLIVADRDNFAAYDSEKLFGYAFVSQKTAVDHAWFRFHFLETMAYMLLAQESIMPVHAACVAHGETGVMLYGLSGAGKSTLAWACARAGWTYVTDDGVWLLPHSTGREVRGRCRQARFRSDARQLFPELAAYLERTVPSGKVSVEVPLSAFPQIRTADRCRVGCVIVLDRQSGARARVEAIPAEEPLGLLLRDMPWYGEEVRARYERTARKLLEVPAWRLTYEDLGEAVTLLTELASGLR